MVFMNFLQTTKVFPINFISAILSAKILYTQNVAFIFIKSKTTKVLPMYSYIMMKSNELQNFSFT